MPKPLHPSAALRAAYDTRLTALVDECDRSLRYWLLARAKPLLATDSAMDDLISAMDRLSDRWTARFEELAPRLADYFARKVEDRVDGTLKSILREGGFTVRFRPSQRQRDVLRATVDENVTLIKSVGEQHLEGVRGAVLRSVTTGRDLGGLTDALVKQHGVTRRRAAFIALDQNNRATAALTRVRQLDAGVTRAKWLHSAGGKTPRPEHVAFSGQTYDVEHGHDFENGEGRVWPGTAIKCRCVSAPVIPGFDS